MTPDQSSLRVLIVDDESLIRWAVAETLTKAGHTVLEAPDGGSALRALREAKEHVDVVLLDLRLPDCADLTLLSSIRSQSPDSAVVMMSAHATPEIAAEARALGVYDVIAKPFDVNGCEQLLRQAHVAMVTILGGV
jgi:DNA-binding NtrC family response regulator